MDMIRAALLAFYTPIILLAGIAAYLYFTGVILPAIKRRRLTLREHGLAICLVLGLFSDVVESSYYAILRIWNAYHGVPHFTVFPSATIKLTILATSVTGLATYYRIVDGKNRMYSFILIAALLWLLTFLVFVLTAEI